MNEADYSRFGTQFSPVHGGFVRIFGFTLSLAQSDYLEHKLWVFFPAKLDVSSMARIWWNFFLNSDRRNVLRRDYYPRCWFLFRSVTFTWSRLFTAQIVLHCIHLIDVNKVVVQASCVKHIYLFTAANRPRACEMFVFVCEQDADNICLRFVWDLCRMPRFCHTLK